MVYGIENIAVYGIRNITEKYHGIRYLELFYIWNILHITHTGILENILLEPEEIKI